jgi:hypothetical protein
MAMLELENKQLKKSFHNSSFQDNSRRLNSESNGPIEVVSLTKKVLQHQKQHLLVSMSQNSSND